MFIVAIFCPILSYGWVGIEDIAYYQTNPLFGSDPLFHRLIASWLHAPESNYIPLTWNMTILIGKVTSHSPQAFHAFSLFLHIVNSLLVLILLKRFGFKLFPAIIVVLLFALHPLRVETVAWASSIKGLLTAFFALGALLAQTSPKLKFRSVILIGCFLLALLCKQTLFLLPCVHFLLASTFTQYQLKKSVYVALGFLSILAVMIAAYANMGNALLAVNQFNDGNFAPLKALSALGHYVKLHFWPFFLFPEYPANYLWWQVLIGILCLIPVGLCIKGALDSERPISSSLSFFACFFILLLPTLGFMTTPLEFAADRLTYLPSVFFWAAFVKILTQACSFVRYVKPPVIATSLVLFSLFFAFLTKDQLSHWKDDSALTSHILTHQPDHYLANLHYANKLAQAEDFQEALSITQMVIRAHPHRYGIQQTRSRIHLSMGNPDVSLSELELALSQSTPIKAGLYLLRGDALRALTRYTEALESIDLAHQYGMDALTIYYHRALTYIASEQISKAQFEINHALTIQPHSVPVLKLKAQLNLETQ